MNDTTAPAYSGSTYTDLAVVVNVQSFLDDIIAGNTAGAEAKAAQMSDDERATFRTALGKHWEDQLWLLGFATDIIDNAQEN